MKTPKTSKRTCKDWKKKDIEKLCANYDNMDNVELGKLLKRSPDAVRKQMNKMRLKRTLKSEVKELEKKAGSMDFFGGLKSGNKQKHRILMVEQKVDRTLNNQQKERQWAEKALQGENVPVVKQTTDKGPQKAIVLTDRTTIFVPAGYTDEQIARVKAKYESRGGLI